MTPSQLLRAKKPSASKLIKLLQGFGFEDAESGARNLTEVLADKTRSKPFLGIADRFFDLAAASPDPDRALLNFGRFLSARPSLDPGFFKQPLAVEMLVKTFSVSQALSDLLIRSPEL